MNICGQGFNDASMHSCTAWLACGEMGHLASVLVPKALKLDWQASLCGRRAMNAQQPWMSRAVWHRRCSAQTQQRSWAPAQASRMTP